MRTNLTALGLILAALPALANAKPKPSLRERPAPASAAPRQPPSQAPTTASVEFADKPLRLETIGLSIYPPTEVTSQVDTAGRDSQITMLAKDASWSLQVRTPRTLDLEATATSVADASLATLFDSYGINDKAAAEATAAGKLLREPKTGEQLVIAGYDATRWTIELPSLDGRKPQVRGFTALCISPGQFVVFDTLTAPASQAKARAIIDTIIGTLKIEDPAKIAAERAAAVAAGTKLTDSITPEILAEIVNAHPERWERRYMPGPSGTDADATEIAYRRIRLLSGPRSLVEPGAAQPRSGGGKSDGFVVQIDARIVGKDGSLTDSRSAYFMSADRDDEVWNIANAFRSPKNDKGAKNEPHVATETGARHGVSMMIHSEVRGSAPAAIKPQFQKEGYLNNVEANLLPYLLIKSGVEIEHGFYAWNPSQRKISLRRDTLASISTGEGERGWKISSQSVDGRRPNEAFYTQSGDLIRIEMSDGSLWEPTTYEALRKLWESKGLPTS